MSNKQICKCGHPIDSHIEQIGDETIAGECISCNCGWYEEINNDL